MVLIDNQTSWKVPKKRIKKILKYLGVAKDIEVVITTNREIQRINSQFRNTNKPTDVLSFPLADEVATPLLGTIVISFDFVKDGAKKYGHKKKDEFILLFLHGLLHLLGYDHEIDNGEMREREREIVKKFGLPDSLIVRTGI